MLPNYKTVDSQIQFNGKRCQVRTYTVQITTPGNDFCCKQCGCKLHADLNASRNIRNNYLHAVADIAAAVSNVSMLELTPPIKGVDSRIKIPERQIQLPHLVRQVTGASNEGVSFCSIF